MKRLGGGRRNWMNSLVLQTATLSLIPVLSPQSAPAYWAPLQNIQAWVEYSGDDQRVVYEVYDPQSQQWVTGTSGWQDAVMNLQTANGIVTWANWRSIPTGSESYAVCATYDPDAGSWKTTGSGSWYDAIMNLQTADGVATWVDWRSIPTGSESYAVCATYDPDAGSWKTTGSGSWYDAIMNLQTADGVATWANWRSTPSGSESSVSCRIYDPQYSDWRTGGAGWCDWVSGLDISNATVTWSSSSGSYTRGYDPATGQWYSGTTQALAYFVPAPTSGYPPLWVWFTDMSIAATSSSWSWTFGDGGSSSSRSPYYTYNNSGLYTATMNLSGPNGSDDASVVVDVLGYPVFSVSPTSHDYGNVSVGGSLVQQFTISNTGTGDLNVTLQEVTGPNSSYFIITQGGGSFTLPAGQSHYTDIKYEPGSAGAHAAAYRITHNGSGSPTEVGLSGTGTGMVLSGGLSGGQLALTWTACDAAAAYWVYGASNEAYFATGFSPGYENRLAVLSAGTSAWSSVSGIGDPSDNWAYLVLAVDAGEQELARSNRFGEHDFGAATRSR